MKNSVSITDGDHKAQSTYCTGASFMGSDRSALIVTVLFVFSVLSIPKFNLQGVIVFAAVPLFLANAARLPLEKITKPLLRLSPFILFMAAGNLFLDRTPLLRLSEVTITGGMLSATVIIAKTLVSVAGILLLTLCIPFHRICAALAAFHVPEVLVTQLILLYRFSAVLREEAVAMQRAREIRSFGKKGKELFRTASLIGSLLLRTINRAERIYRGMSARGFNGHMKFRSAGIITAAELVTTGFWALSFIALRLIF
jgi:cobalt/nickel transport system permease protein